MSASFRPVFDHIHLRSLDPDAAGRFYVEMLGATHVARDETDKLLRVSVAFPGVNIFIDRVPAGTNRAAGRPHLGLEHVGLKIDDVDAAAAELKAKGVAFTLDPVDFRPGLRIAFLVGPDDVSIELLQRG